MSQFEILYHPLVIKNDIPSLPKVVRKKIFKAIENRLLTDPIKYGKPLRYSLKGHRRIRVGDYRVVYRIIPPRQVLILVICHRKDVYGIDRS
ncbi:MAG TPA: type II toxin-antitoxin system RelE/ParE family toxin [Bdellovibrionota bacterium]|nr:type II toxin-antitoxin system RelE/ParE family toxin [Bdellovibrionota bacterium]